MSDTTPGSSPPSIVIVDVASTRPLSRQPQSPSSATSQSSRLSNYQKNDILSAIASLGAYRNYRYQSEKSRKDKSAEEQLRLEIRKPLDDALEEIQSLTKKLARREEYIVGLRRLVGLEAIAANASAKSAAPSIGSASSRSLAMEAIVESERTQIFQLCDEIDRLEESNKLLAAENEKLQRRNVSLIQDKKQHYLTLEQQSIVTKESLRQLERERDHSLAMIAQRDGLLERANSELTRTKEELSDLKYHNIQNKILIENLQRDKINFGRELESLNVQLIDKSARLVAVEALIQQAKDKVISVTTENYELQRKYERIVTELDSIVARMGSKSEASATADSAATAAWPGAAGSQPDDEPDADQGKKKNRTRLRIKVATNSDEAKASQHQQHQSEIDTKLIEDVKLLQSDLQHERNRVESLSSALTAVTAEREQYKEKISLTARSMKELSENVTSKETELQKEKMAADEEIQRLKLANEQLQQSLKERSDQNSKFLELQHQLQMKEALLQASESDLEAIQLLKCEERVDHRPSISDDIDAEHVAEEARGDGEVAAASQGMEKNLLLSELERDKSGETSQHHRVDSREGSPSVFFAHPPVTNQKVSLGMQDSISAAFQAGSNIRNINNNVGENSILSLESSDFSNVLPIRSIRVDNCNSQNDSSQFDRWMRTIFQSLLKASSVATARSSMDGPNSNDGCTCQFRKRNQAALHMLYALCSNRNDVVRSVHEQSVDSGPFYSSGCKQVICCLDLVLIFAALALLPTSVSADEAGAATATEEKLLLQSFTSHVLKGFNQKGDDLEYLLIWELEGIKSWERYRERILGRSSAVAEGSQDVEKDQGDGRSGACNCSCCLSKNVSTEKRSNSTTMKRYMNRSSIGRPSAKDSVFVIPQECNLELGESDCLAAEAVRPMTTSVVDNSCRSSEYEYEYKMMKSRPLTSPTKSFRTTFVTSPALTDNTVVSSAIEAADLATIDKVKLVGVHTSPTAIKSRKSKIGEFPVGNANYSMSMGTDVVALPPSSVENTPKISRKSAIAKSTKDSAQEGGGDNKVSSAVYAMAIDAGEMTVTLLSPSPPATTLQSSKPPSARQSAVKQQSFVVNQTTAGEQLASSLQVKGSPANSIQHKQAPEASRPSSASLFADANKRKSSLFRKSGLVRTVGPSCNYDDSIVKDGSNDNVRVRVQSFSDQPNHLFPDPKSYQTDMNAQVVAEFTAGREIRVTGSHASNNQERQKVTGAIMHM